jgi:uncharacterized protein with von Willebrand factor type A (vWA) domain
VDEPLAVGDGAGAALAVRLARMLRAAGVEVPVASTVLFAEALGEVGVGDELVAYWAGRASLVRRMEDVPAYDRAFAAWWAGATPRVETTLPGSAPGPAGSPGGAEAAPEPGGERRPPGEQAAATLPAGAPATGGAPEGDEARTTVLLRYSATEVLRHKDFACCTSDELAEAYALMARIPLAAPRRRSRRRRPARVGRLPSRARFDLRRTTRLALRTGGEAVRRATSEPATRARRVVLLCDISGSMAPYARALVRFCHVAIAGGARVEAFTLGTRLTRVTRELAVRDPDAALARAGQAVRDWSGGTRLGECLATFNDRYGVRGMARGAVVVILSDGWDRGDPQRLGEEMARLARVAHRVVWVNPLKASPGYAPLARGMAAALPHVDAFVEGHSVASLEVLAKVVAA